MPGGIIFQRDLKHILQIARDLGNEEILFGSRQDIMFRAGKADMNDLEERFRDIPLDFEWGNQKYQNIVTSYVAVDVMPTTPWVTAGTYHYVLEHFQRKHRMKVNITDPAQSLVPLFYGDLNFVASEHEDYWYLYLKSKRNAKLIQWPVLVFSPDIGPVAQALEELLLPDESVSRTDNKMNGRDIRKKTPGGDSENTGDLTQETVDRMFMQLSEQLKPNNRTITSPLKLSAVPFPYYEGLNKGAGGKYWLGLYWRNNRYDISFLEKVCDLCEQTDTGRLIVTPWKSFIIKDIDEADTRKWEYLCGVNGINFRHSSIELNWHLPVLDEAALKLKNYLVREFNRQDVSTYGLTFSINTQPENAFTSVVITREPNLLLFGKFGINHQFTVYYSKGFNPNERVYTSYGVNVTQSRLPQVVTRLSRYYFEKAKLKEHEFPASVAAGYDDQLKNQKRNVYQCRHCLTIYDSEHGDPSRDISPGVPFSKLPDTYSCSLCDAPKKDFSLAILNESIQ